MRINPDEFTNEVSPLARKIIGSACSLITLFLGVTSWFAEDEQITILSFVIGIPLGLVGISLLFGQAKRGQGIFSPFTLYLVGGCIVVASIGGIYADVPSSIFGVLFGFGCFVLAKKRKHKRKSFLK